MICRASALLTILLPALLPCLTLAQGPDFGVYPAEMEIGGILPGQQAEFEITILNRDKAPRLFTITSFQPLQESRRQGRDELPDAGWIALSPVEIELPAASESTVTVAVAIPAGREWAGRHWEIWLRVACESDDLFDVEVYVRLLISTASATETGSDTRIMIAIAAGMVLLGSVLYYGFRHRAGPA
ncbi:MAG: hypothetical protein IBX67_08160 [Dehalococcoidia bacterium]|nr:hypothetical protein [Dehalococcoidia bacterium]